MSPIVALCIRFVSKIDFRAVRSRNIVETQDFCYNKCRTLDAGKKGGTPMYISYQPLWNTLKERGMRKEDLRLAAGLTTNMIANMGKGKYISMETLLRICKTLNCNIADVIELVDDRAQLNTNEYNL